MNEKKFSAKANRAQSGKKSLTRGHLSLIVKAGGSEHVEGLIGRSMIETLAAARSADLFSLKGKRGAKQIS